MDEEEMFSFVLGITGYVGFLVGALYWGIDFHQKRLTRIAIEAREILKKKATAAVVLMRGYLTAMAMKNKGKTRLKEVILESGLHCKEYVRFLEDKDVVRLFVWTTMESGFTEVHGLISREVMLYLGVQMVIKDFLDSPGSEGSIDRAAEFWRKLATDDSALLGINDSEHVDIPRVPSVPEVVKEYAGKPSVNTKLKREKSARNQESYEDCEDQPRKHPVDHEWFTMAHDLLNPARDKGGQASDEPVVSDARDFEINWKGKETIGDLFTYQSLISKENPLNATTGPDEVANSPYTSGKEDFGESEGRGKNSEASLDTSCTSGKSGSEEEDEWHDAKVDDFEKCELDDVRKVMAQKAKKPVGAFGLTGKVALLTALCCFSMVCTAEAVPDVVVRDTLLRMTYVSDCPKKNTVTKIAGPNGLPYGWINYKPIVDAILDDQFTSWGGRLAQAHSFASRRIDREERLFITCYITHQAKIKRDDAVRLWNETNKKADDNANAEDDTGETEESSSSGSATSESELKSG